MVTTANRIFEAALDLFREQGFESATMRQIAQAAGVATGAAYYYYPSKDAIILDFYRRSSAAMQPAVDAVPERYRTLESRLRELIQVKLTHFAPDRPVLRALLRNGADPAHPLSPFSAESKDIRDRDIEGFRRILSGCGVRVTGDLEARLPGMLWFFQMGVIFFWVTDESPGQKQTQKLLQLAVKAVVNLIRLSSLPLMRPVRRMALQLAAVVTNEDVL